MNSLKQLHCRFCLILIYLTYASHVLAENHQVIVLDPFLEMRTGPGRGYPVFHIAEEGDSIEIDKRRTDWCRPTDHRRYIGGASGCPDRYCNMEPPGLANRCCIH